MKNKIHIFLITAFLFSMVFLNAGPSQGFKDKGARHGHRGDCRRQESAEANRLPAGIELRDTSGKTWIEENLRGKIVVIEFWATWCAPCLEQIPKTRALYEEYRNNDVVILGVNLDTAERRTTRRWLQRNSRSVSWPQVLTRHGFNGELPRYFNIREVPEMLIFGRDGKLVSRNTSADVTASVIAALIAAENRNRANSSTHLSARD